MRRNDMHVDEQWFPDGFRFSSGQQLHIQQRNRCRAPTGDGVIRVKAEDRMIESGVIMRIQKRHRDIVPKNIKIGNPAVAGFHPAGAGNAI